MERRLKVLLADDSADQLVTLAAVLEDEGFDVVSVLDAENIVPTAATFRPDVYLLDIGMPRCDGYETTKKLRELYGPGPLIIAVTAFSRPADRVRSLQAGFDFHIVKPFDTLELVALMRDNGYERPQTDGSANRS